MTTSMGKALNKTAPGKPGVSRFQEAIAATRVLVPFVIPGIELPCLMTLVGSERYIDLDAQSRRACEERGYRVTDPSSAYLVQDRFELELARHVLQEACRDADPKLADTTPAGSLAEWGQLSGEVINACWQRYSELREVHDPLGDHVRIDTTEIVAIRDAIQKKNAVALRSYGLNKLIAYLHIMGDQPSSSPTPRFESGDTSPDISSGVPSPAEDRSAT